jgi:hypothetical protein
MPHFYRPFAVVMAGLLLFLVIPSLVSAQPSTAPTLAFSPSGIVLYDNRATFNAAAPGLPVEDWEEGHVTGPFIFCNPPLNSNSNDACFLPGEILPGLEFQDAPLGGGSDHVGLGGPGSWSMPSKFVYSNYSVETTNLFFTPTVTAIGVDLSSNGIGNAVLISIYDASDTLILTDTTTLGNLGELTFWGVISSIPIERLNIDILNSEFVDNVAFGGAIVPITPTPSPTATPSPTPTASATATPSPTATPSLTPTASATATPSPTPQVPTVVSLSTVTASPPRSWIGSVWGTGLLLTVGALWAFRRK